MDTELTTKFMNKDIYQRLDTKLLKMIVAKVSQFRKTVWRYVPLETLVSSKGLYAIIALEGMHDQWRT